MQINISQPNIGNEEIEAVVSVLKSGRLVQGKKTTLLEKKLSEYCQTKYAVAVNSGTAAIHTALYASKVGAGDEVITTPFTFVATANPILMQHAKVIFADISEKDFNLDPKKVEEKISPRTKGIIAVDLYGQMANYSELIRIAKKHHLIIIEDACQAIGASQNNKKAGNITEIATFSLYATKNIMCGEGGFLTTDDAEIAQKARMFRNHGQLETRRYEYFDLGYNYRMLDLTASLALEQLKKVEQLNKQRIKNARQLSLGLTGIKGLILPAINPGNHHVFHQYTIRIDHSCSVNRDQLFEQLISNKIMAEIYYPKPLHLHHHFRKLGYKKGDFPVAEKMASQVLSLPIHPLLTQNQIDYMIKTIKAITNKESL